MSRWQNSETWLARWGFAAMVALAAVLAFAVGSTVAIPADVPGIALQAAMVYRVEVGGAIFIGIYVAAMAFVLALQNRGFTEVGSLGLRAEQLIESREVIEAQEAALAEIAEVVRRMKRRQALEREK